MKRAGLLGKGYQKRLKLVMTQYTRRAQHAKLDPSMVVYDYFDGLDEGEQAVVPRQPGETVEAYMARTRGGQ